MGEALVKILNKAGIEVIFPEGQTCCGAPARYSGAYEVAAQNASDNINALLEQDVKYVVSACPTCTVALKQDFISHLREPGPDRCAARAPASWRPRSIDFSTLVKKLVDEGRLTFKEGQHLGKVTYHDSCHLKRTLNVSEQPRELLTKAGYEIAEMYESRHVLRHGRLVLAEAAGDFGAHPRAQAGEHQGNRRAAGGDGLSRVASCRFAEAWTKTAPRSRWSTPRSAWRTPSNSWARVQSFNVMPLPLRLCA